jgi:hypothetical protein
MSRSLFTAYLFGALLVFTAVVGNLVGTVRGDQVSLNYAKIKFDYVAQDSKGITFGGDSTFPALPADFFDTGSLPFEGLIGLQSAGDTAMAIIRKTGGAFPDPPAPVDIPIEIVALNLASVEPIVVSYDSGAIEQWDVKVNKDMNSSCWIRVAHHAPGEPDGGTILPFDSFFDIFAEVTFTNTSPSGERRIRGFAIIDRSHLTTSDAKWAHQHASIAGGANREFVPGADPANPSAPLQVLLFEGGGLDLQLQVTDIVPEPASLALLVAGAALVSRRRGRR